MTQDLHNPSSSQSSESSATNASPAATKTATEKPRMVTRANARRAIPSRRERSRRTVNPWRQIPEKQPLDVIVYTDGRECCNQKTEGGRAEYKRRLETMLIRQGYRCCGPCRKPLTLSMATWEHEDLRGKDIDERIEVKGKPKNGASCWPCNRDRGSKRTKIWHGEQE